jgi:hypothetical protein
VVHQRTGNVALAHTPPGHWRTPPSSVLLPEGGHYGVPHLPTPLVHVALRVTEDLGIGAKPEAVQYDCAGIGHDLLGLFYDGVEFIQEYAAGVSITWTVTFSQNGGLALLGSVDATGAGFTGQSAGCNGDFPPMRLKAGKTD